VTSLLALLLIGAQGPSCKVTPTVVQTLTGFDVALEFQLEPGWHIYWKNPGDSGEATTVKWNLPEGWSDMGLLFPTPHAIDAGGVINYGYENKVTLLARLKPPVDYSGETVNLTGEASYLICKEACVPGSRKISLTLPAKPVDSKKWSALLGTFPQKLDAPISSTVTGRSLVISIKSEHIANAHFFPESATVIDHSATQRLDRTTGGFKLTIPVSKYSTSRPEKVAGVLVLTKDDASVCGYQVELTP
jgi:thiol:disulfide interchange protein DsbD